MSEYYRFSQDQTLLVEVVKEAERVVKTEGSFLGRTAIQKIMYVLRVLGVPMSYKFDIHYYGPFCQDILMDMELLRAHGVVIDNSTEPKKYSNYAPGASIDEPLSENCEFISDHLKTIKGIVKALAPLEPDRLELITTIDFLYRQAKALRQPSEGSRKDYVVSRFIKVKKAKFPRHNIEQTYDLLTEIGLIEGEA